MADLIRSPVYQRWTPFGSATVSRASFRYQTSSLPCLCDYETARDTEHTVCSTSAPDDRVLPLWQGGRLLGALGRVVGLSEAEDQICRYGDPEWSTPVAHPAVSGGAHCVPQNASYFYFVQEARAQDHSHPLWKLRTKEEAAQFWKKEFGHLDESSATLPPRDAGFTVKSPCEQAT